MSIKLVTRSVWSNPGNRGQRLRRMMAAVAWQLHKRLLRTPKVLRLANGRLFSAHPDCVISSALVYADFPEYDELRFIRSNLRPTDSVIDIGANVGHIGLLLSDIVASSEIDAFEPTPLTYGRLPENWELNPDCPPPHLYQMAVGDAVSNVLIPDRSQPDTMNSIITTEKARQSSVNVVGVPMTTLDSLANTWEGKAIGLLKIDVEGYENAVFTGAQAFIVNHRPRLIMFESLSGNLSPMIANVLASARFDVFQLDDGKPVFGPSSAQNLFACPTEESQSLRTMA